MEEKPLTEFYRRSDKKSECYRPKCKACHSSRAAAKWQQDEAFRSTGKDRSYKWLLANKYGLKPEDYDQMFSDQQGVCAICGGDNSGKRFCVDHCHTTGKVRGLLCDHCNKGLGCFKDNTNSLLQAISYLCAS